jgi:pantoate--beta-alanine ligase
MKIVKTIAELDRELALPRTDCRSVGFVPTMGALHQGHISLVEKARRSSDYVVVSIFINPKQFAPGEDLSRYPRNLEGDLALLQDAGADLAFVPEVDEFYPPEFATIIKVEGPALGLCGEFRPDHFAGVATIVVKLFNLVKPQKAFFGLKDMQQYAVIKRVVADLNLSVEIVPGPTVREADGLAMSSRNAYLSAEERRVAPEIYRALEKAEEMYRTGERDAERLLAIVEQHLDGFPAIQVQYLEAVDPNTMSKRTGMLGQVALAIAAYVGKTRLIDNIILDEQEPNK